MSQSADAKQSWWTSLVPKAPMVRRLALQSMLFAVGEGTFATGNAVYFTHIVGLTAAQVGLGLTIAGAAAFLVAVPVGRLADRFGPRRFWVLGAALSAALYLAYPAIHGFAAFVAVIVAIQIADSTAHGARWAYTIDLFPREERVSTQAYMRSALNVGFTVGALLGGLALASNSDTLIRLVPILSAAVLGLNALLITRLPHVGHHSASQRARAVTPGALRNKPFLALSTVMGVLSTHNVLLTVVIPLWVVQRTDAPRVLLAWLFGTNTVLAVLLQVRAARGSDTIPGAIRSAWRSGAFFVASCLVVLVTHSTIGWVTIALVWFGHVVVTGAELFEAGATWGLTAELSDPNRLGEYQGAGRLGRELGGVWAPALYTALALSWGPPGWIVIATIIVVATLGVRPSVRAAERYLETHVGSAQTA